MFTCGERHTVSRVLAVATVAAWLLLPGVGQSPAYGEPTNEKGPRCSDGMDNDGDGLIDCDDPDCGCGADGGGGGGGGDDIPVCVTFDDIEGDLATSDGGGPYCNGVDGIIAFIGSRGGSLKLDTAESSRQVVLNFPECPRLIGGDCSTDGFLRTMDDQTAPETGKLDLRAMAEGETRFADFQIAFPSDLSRSTPNLVIFGGHNLGSNACGTSLPVTRQDAVTWTIEAAASDLACLFEVVARNNRRELTDIDFALPFRITIAAQP